MYRRMTVKQLEELAVKNKTEKDIVDILKDAGYGVVEGKDAVLAKIYNFDENSPVSVRGTPKDRSPYLDRP